MWSNTPQSCAPLPLCVDQTTTFTDLSRVQQNASLWDGNATAYDWVINKGEMVSTGQEGVLKLTESNGGTKISSARYVHYGKISATLKTSSNVGVVTALITMSDVKVRLSDLCSSGLQC
jgi:beta-glucanase (GH16 family)